ncbi:hypothetical protein ACTG9Q_24250 [Actinokineospora sp. 24-640]
MIDWVRQGRALALVAADPGRAQAIARTVAAVSPVHANKDFAVPPLPLFVERARVPGHAADVEGYARLLGRLLALFVEDRQVQAYFRLRPAELALCLAPARLSGRVWIARLDGYLAEDTLAPVVLENNADAPAGTLFTPRVNALVDTVYGELDTAHRPGGFADDRVFVHALLAAAAEGGLDRDEVVLAVLQPRGAPNRESEELITRCQGLGVEAFLADPRDVQVDGERVSFAGRRATLAWNKVNTAGWRRLAADCESTWRAALDARFVHVNPFAARFVAESKLALACVQTFAAKFSAEEQAVAARLLPWSAKLAPDMTHPHVEADVLAHLADHRGRYVIKEHYDIRGDGVTIGHAVSGTHWRQRLGQGVREGWVVQRYVPPARVPVPDPTGRVVPMAVSLDSFLFAGRFHGFGAKAGQQAKVNVFQGGVKVAVRGFGEDGVGGGSGAG